MNKERHPTKKQVQKVIDTLTKVLPVAQKMQRSEKCSVDMRSVLFGPECGTPMCHAGWYAAAKNKDRIQTNGFRGAADIMAKDLGFKSSNELRTWAEKNPEMWGTEYGQEMFCDERAFVKEGKTVTLIGIINHWKKVQKRLPR